jgi:hypothetical protein
MGRSQCCLRGALPPKKTVKSINAICWRKRESAHTKMSHVSATLDQPAVTRHLPAVWEVLRAVSGLVAIIALLVIMTGVAVQGDSGRAHTVLPVPAAGQPEPVPSSAASAPAASPTREVVLYVVETVEQLQIAELGEDYAKIATPGRRYGMVSTDAALDLAVQDVVQESLTSGRPIQLQVVDMRDSVR